MTSHFRKHIDWNEDGSAISWRQVGFAPWKPRGLAAASFRGSPVVRWSRTKWMSFRNRELYVVVAAAKDKTRPDAPEIVRKTGRAGLAI